MKRALLLVILPALLLQQSVPSSAQAPDALGFFKNYFITGDYVVGGVGLRGQGVNGIATGSIVIQGVPQGADVLAAFLYWQVVTKGDASGDSGSIGATFRGYPLSAAGAEPFAKVLGSGTPPCWSSGGGTGSSGGTNETRTYRADGLRYFDIDPATGKYRINGTHEVQLPDGNGTIALGASAVVIYRDPNPAAPLKAIVIYDGAYTMDQTTEGMSQRIRGFYDGGSTAKLTHIVGSGQANKSENLRVNGTKVATNPFAAVQGLNWDNYTFDLTAVEVPEPPHPDGSHDLGRSPGLQHVRLPHLGRHRLQHAGERPRRRRAARHLGILDDPDRRSDGPDAAEPQGDGREPGPQGFIRRARLHVHGSRLHPDVRRSAEALTQPPAAAGSIEDGR